MVYELRKNMARNMRYAQMNDEIEQEIEQLKSDNSPEMQMRISTLQQQRDDNFRQMQQPMTDAEYEQYDNYGHYLGTETQQNQAHSQQQNSGGIGQTIADGVNHVAQGASLGWSDEAFGAIGGAGRTAANGVMRALGQNVSGESFGDAWNKGYQEYRDFARQELNDGYQRNPAISAGSEIIGSAISPITPFKARGFTGSLGKIVSHPEDIARARWLNSVATGTANGAGYTNQNTWGEYAKNIGKSIVTNSIGTALGNKAFGRYNDMYRVGRETANGIADSIPYTYDLYQRRKNGK